MKSDVQIPSTGFGVVNKLVNIAVITCTRRRIRNQGETAAVKHREADNFI